MKNRREEAILEIAQELDMLRPITEAIYSVTRTPEELEQIHEDLIEKINDPLLKVYAITEQTWCKIYEEKGNRIPEPKIIRCGLCDKEFNVYESHNGNPLVDKPVCSRCNAFRVLPTRLQEQQLISKEEFVCKSDITITFPNRTVKRYRVGELVSAMAMKVIAQHYKEANKYFTLISLPVFDSIDEAITFYEADGSTFYEDGSYLTYDEKYEMMKTWHDEGMIVIEEEK